jgi:transposase
MSSQTWKVMYSTIRRADRSIARKGRRPVYPDTLIVAMYLWAVWHDRPMSWSANRNNYTTLFRPRRLPSRSQFCRRIKSLRCQALLQGVYDRLADIDTGNRTSIMLMDGRGFRVGPYTTDPEANNGYSSGGYARGYRLHALARENGRFVQIRVTPMNINEKQVARELIDKAHPHGVVLADQGYESGPLYDYIKERGAQLLTPLPKNAGGGHRRQSPARLLAKRIWASGGETLYKRRDAIERFFGQLSAFGGGLSPLPAWVRRLERVERWITAKVTIYHARLLAKEQAA